ncbi:LamG domain-containing protein [Haloferula sp. BvORR071]|uniref:LamG domain-containing protein n=1 Tax=Haloferula sp. BvORR071 TaxID=1396141 RepID=UPI000A63A378|nr:LamG domain-containing protein [Haloferula sp. BvORR071]
MKLHCLFLAASLGMSTASHAVLTAGLVGYFDFESSLTNQAAAVGSDYGGTFEDGSLTETDAITDYTVGASGGRSGNGLNVQVAGTTGSVNGVTIPIGFGGGQDLGASFTVSSWVNLDATTASNGSARYFVYEGLNNFDLSLSLRAVSGAAGINDIQVFTEGTSGAIAAQATYADLATPGEWVNIVQVYAAGATNTTISTYINGTLQGTMANANANISATGILLGRARGGTNNRHFDGMIDEVGLWNRALDQDEVTAIFTAGQNGQAIPEPAAALLGSLGLIALLRRRVR